MYLHRNSIPYEIALEKITALPVLPKIEEIPVNKGLNRYLGEDFIAPFSFPFFRRSGYDGYGILKEDDQEFPKTFILVKEVAAGETTTTPLKSGETIRIMTGAKVPDEVSKVIMLEKTEKLADNQVRILESGKKDNILPIGQEFEKGDLLLKKGQKINPGTLSLLSAFGKSTVAVFKKPQVAILTTGSELLHPGENPVSGKIYDSNGPLLSGLVRENGGEVIAFERISDHLEETRQQVKQLLKTCDLVITSGGVSVGDFDFMAVLAKESDELLFNKLEMRPGSPTTAFISEGKPVIALSGNPGACFTGFYLFVEPLLKAFFNQASEKIVGTFPIAHDYLRKNAYDRFLRGQLSNGKVQLVGSDESSALGNLPFATCLFKIPRNTEVKAGDEVTVWQLP